MKKIYYTLAYLFLLGIPSYILYDSKRDKFFVWQYNEKSILGLKIRGVPIEDYVLFLILTPIFIIALYKFIEKLSQ